MGVRNAKNLKVALVCDWLTESGGAEKVLLRLSEIYPAAPIFTSQYRPKTAKWFSGKDVRAGWLNRFPAALRKFLAPLRARYFSHLDLTDFDLVISVVNAECKAVRTRPDALHIAYLQGPPTQYYWGKYDDYIQNPGFGKLNWLARLGLKILVKPLRKWDRRAAQNPDVLVANSGYVKADIKKYYGRDSQIVWPSVDVKKMSELARKYRCRRSGFVVAGRQVNWKRIDLAIRACQKTGDHLTVIGYGAEHQKLVKLAAGAPNIKFLPRYDGAAELAKILAHAQGLIFPSHEPFGIVAVEALAAGCPVIALEAGGALDFIEDGQNGVFFEKQTVDSLIKALKKFETLKFDETKIARSAVKFDAENFDRNWRRLVENCLKS